MRCGDGEADAAGANRDRGRADGGKEDAAVLAGFRVGQGLFFFPQDDGKDGCVTGKDLNVTGGEFLFEVLRISMKPPHEAIGVPRKKPEGRERRGAGGGADGGGEDEGARMISKIRGDGRGRGRVAALGA